MDLENVTQPFASLRDQATRLGGTFAREGRVLGARALRQGSSQLQRTATRLDELASQLEIAPEAAESAAAEAAPAAVEPSPIEAVSEVPSDEEAVSAERSAGPVEGSAEATPAVPQAGASQGGRRRR